MHGRNWSIAIFLGILFATSLFLGLYKSDTNFMFSQDQALDMYTLRDISHLLTTRNFSSLPIIGEHGEGPLDTEWWGSIYHGVFFSYFLLPFAVLSRFSVPALVAILSVISASGVFLIYRAGEWLFDRRTGVVAAILYATSFWIVGYGNEIWTPTLQPFFTLIALVGLAGVTRGHQAYWPLLGFGAAATSQVHSSGYLLLLFLAICVVWFRLRPKTWRVAVLTSIATLLPITPTLLAQVTDGFVLPTSILRAVAYQLTRPTDGWVVYEVPRRFFQFLASALGIADFGAGIGDIQKIFGVILGSAIIYWAAQRQHRPNSRIGTLVLIFFFVFFFPIPWVAQVYYHLGRGQTEWIFSRMFFALPFLFLALGHVVATMLIPRWGRVLGLIALVSYVFANLFVIVDMQWLNEQGHFDYGMKKEMVEWVVADAAGEPFEVVFSEGFRVGPELVYLFETQGLPLPERMNNKKEVQVWRLPTQLPNGEASIIYVFVDVNHIPELPKKGMRIVYYNQHFVIYRIEKSREYDPQTLFL